MTVYFNSTCCGFSLDTTQPDKLLLIPSTCDFLSNPVTSSLGIGHKHMTNFAPMGVVKHVNMLINGGNRVSSYHYHHQHVPINWQFRHFLLLGSILKNNVGVSFLFVALFSIWTSSFPTSLPKHLNYLEQALPLPSLTKRYVSTIVLCLDKVDTNIIASEELVFLGQKNCKPLGYFASFRWMN